MSDKTKKRVKLAVILIGVSIIVMATKCPWFQGLLESDFWK